MGDPRRTRRALALLDGGRSAFLRTARRVSFCEDDAHDALQRASLILLEKAPDYPEARLTAWMHVVTRREALALRRERERHVGPDLSELAEVLPCAGPCPAEQAERRDAARQRARDLAQLKPAERRALVLRAEGYSYREICALTGWTYTKVNRSLAEGRARLRDLRLGC